MNETGIVEALADALEAAAATLRRSSQLTSTPQPSQDQTIKGAVARARAMHPMLGPRQAEILSILEQHGTTGTNTGMISGAIHYDQPNVYLTLQVLINLGFVQKDETVSPHIYRLTPILTDSTADAA